MSATKLAIGILLAGMLAGLLVVGWPKMQEESRREHAVRQQILDAQTAAKVAKIESKLPLGCRFLDLGKFDEYGQVTAVICDGRRSSTLKLESWSGKQWKRAVSVVIE